MANIRCERCSASFVIREMQLKPQRDIITHLLEWLKQKRLTMIWVGGNMEKLELSYFVHQNVTTLGNSLQFKKKNGTYIYDRMNSFQSQVFMQKERRRLSIQRLAYKCHSSVCSNQHQEQFKFPSTSEWINNTWHDPTMEEHSAIKRKELSMAHRVESLNKDAE